MSDPVITRIERQKRNSRRVSVYLDDAFAFGIEEDVAYQHQLVKGRLVSQEFAALLMEQSARIEARRIAERLLSARMRSERELHTRLVRREIPPAVADSVIADLRRIGLLDDEAFARAYIADRMLLRPRSRQLLGRELKSKGVAPEIVERVLDRLAGGEMEVENATAVLRKYLARQSSMDAGVSRRRVYAALVRRGFSADVIRSAFRAAGAPAPDSETSSDDE
jgi:regulatory protein